MEIVIEGEWNELDEIGTEIRARYADDQLLVRGPDPIPISILRPRVHGQVELYHLVVEFGLGFSANVAANLATDYLRELIERKRNKPVTIVKGKEIVAKEGAAAPTDDEEATGAKT